MGEEAERGEQRVQQLVARRRVVIEKVRAQRTVHRVCLVLPHARANVSAHLVGRSNRAAAGRGGQLTELQMKPSPIPNRRSSTS